MHIKQKPGSQEAKWVTLVHQRSLFILLEVSRNELKGTLVKVGSHRKSPDMSVIGAPDLYRQTVPGSFTGYLSFFGAQVSCVLLNIWRCVTLLYIYMTFISSRLPCAFPSRECIYTEGCPFRHCTSPYSSPTKWGLRYSLIQSQIVTRTRDSQEISWNICWFAFTSQSKAEKKKEKSFR